MKERIVSLRTAKLAKEKGFDEQCNDCYNGKGYLYSNGWCERVDEHFEESFSNSELEQVFLYYFTAPTQSLLQKWLREEKDILVYVDPKSHHFFESHIITSNNEIIGDRRDNWENVLEDGLYLALKEL